MTTRPWSTFLLAVAVVGGQIGETAGLVSAAGQVCAAIAQAALLGLLQVTITIAEELTPPFAPPETFQSRGFAVDG